MNSRLTLADIAAKLAKTANITVEEAENFIIEFFGVAGASLVDGKDVTIKGLGIFTITDDEESPVVFLPEQSFADAVNAPFALFEPVELNDNVTEEMLNGAEAPNQQPLSEPEVKQEPQSEPEPEPEPESESEPEPQPEPEVPAENESAEPVVAEQEVVEQQEVIDEEPIQEILERQVVEQEVIEEDAVVSYSETEYEPVSPKHRCRNIILVVFLIVASYFAGLFTPAIIEKISCNCTVNHAEESPVAEQPAVTADNNEINVDDPVTVTEEISLPQPEVATVHLDTVRVKYYITHMAKRYYGNDNFWSYIYKENEDKLGHPDLTQPGTVVVIPPAEKYSIDASNPESVSAAKALGYEIYSRFR